MTYLKSKLQICRFFSKIYTLILDALILIEILVLEKKIKKVWTQNRGEIFVWKNKDFDLQKRCGRLFSLFLFRQNFF